MCGLMIKAQELDSEGKITTDNKTRDFYYNKDMILSFIF